MKLNIPITEKLLAEYLETRKYSVKTNKQYQYSFKMFTRYLVKISKEDDIRNITRQDMKAFIDYLHDYEKKDKSPLANDTRMGIFYNIKCFFKYLYQMEYLLYNPVDGVDLKLKKNNLAKKIMSIEEMEKFLSSIHSIEPAVMIRDRALFELMYITGMRSGEILNLNISDIDFKKDEVLIRGGKGGKDRIVVMGQISKKYLHEYISKYRKVFLGSAKDDGAVFITKRFSRRMTHGSLESQFRKYLKDSGIKKKLSPHCIRHTAGTHILEGGADIRYAQKFLGHKSIETTVIYTHFLTDSIKKLFRKYHPRENSLYEEIPEDLEEKIKVLVEKYKRKKNYW